MAIIPTAMRVARWFALAGLACGILYSFGGFFVDLFTTGLNLGTVLAFGALVGMPLLFGLCGFACGALVAAIRRAAGASRQS